MANTTTLYVLSEVEWMYNDETYYTSEYDAGTPEKAYRDKEKAKRACKKLNVERIVGLHRLGEYSYDWQEQVNIEKLKDVAKKLNGELIGDDWEAHLSGIHLPVPEKHWDDLLAAVDIKFYRVDEVEMVDA